MGEVLASLPEKQATEWRYRLMSPMGVYPNSSVHVDGASLVITKGLVSLACLESENCIEIGLKISILCSSVEASDTFKFYSFPSYHQLLDPCLPSELADTLLFDVQQKQAGEYADQGETIPEFDWYENSKGASLPPILGGTEYHKVNLELDMDVIKSLYQSWKDTPCAKLRSAVRAIIGCNALSCHHQFRQEACGLLLDGLRLLQEVEEFHSDSAYLSTVLAQLGDNAEDYLISRQQMSEKTGPIDFHRLFVQSCTQLRKYLLGH